MLGLPLVAGYMEKADVPCCEERNMKDSPREEDRKSRRAAEGGLS